MSDEQSSDFDDFRQAMGDVKPLKHKARVGLKSSKESESAIRARRESATEEPESNFNELSGEFIDAVDPHALLSFQRPGVQHGVFRNLRLGKYHIDARLDLHRHSVEQARTAVFTFIRDCLEYDIRCALITHGKGEGRQQPALMKSCIAHWLPQLDAVLAFHSAQKQHGSTGATYVLLRKSERKRHENLERHQKRRP
ncbi:DNA endonuclease SmrA [Pseudomaricurvus alkylphenolicus]|jgi:DNA-nicking Smr family endonuclease|uniref:DNA endonuclease SmrA n=1 Tax=Pseudomaricurvus alkylphenolicus TaxID=1306991 RepID=UPI001423CD64|nr:DNA endonuclease SmrA [Pseudomaricurvus alkylphenolicus]NIB39278.1 DNA endonuclease SmrA [Pseudomaricurvus alkylphenolicus]